MTAILSQMDNRHYASYIETFSGTTDLVVRQQQPHATVQEFGLQSAVGDSSFCSLKFLGQGSGLLCPIETYSSVDE